MYVCIVGSRYSVAYAFAVMYTYTASLCITVVAVCACALVLQGSCRASYSCSYTSGATVASTGCVVTVTVVAPTSLRYEHPSVAAHVDCVHVGANGG